jgi:hypothetical protein
MALTLGDSWSLSGDCFSGKGQEMDGRKVVEGGKMREINEGRWDATSN